MFIKSQWEYREIISKIITDSGKAHSACNDVLDLRKQIVNGLYYNDKTICYKSLTELLDKIGYIQDYLNGIDEQAMELLNDTVVV